MPSLLEQFVAEEVTQHGRARIDDALANKGILHHLNFNRFEITVDHEGGVVLIEDVTDASSAGAERLPLSDFALIFSRLSVQPDAP